MRAITGEKSREENDAQGPGTAGFSLPKNSIMACMGWLSEALHPTTQDCTSVRYARRGT